MKNNVVKNKSDFEGLANKNNVSKSLIESIFATINNEYFLKQQSLIEKFGLLEIFIKTTDKEDTIALLPEEYQKLTELLEFQAKAIENIYLKEQERFLEKLYGVEKNNEVEAGLISIKEHKVLLYQIKDLIKKAKKT